MHATNVDQTYCFSISCFDKSFSFCIKRLNVAYNVFVLSKEEAMDSSYARLSPKKVNFSGEEKELVELHKRPQKGNSS